MKLLQGNCIEQMRGLEAGSVDAIVTDPPYGLGFMGKAWDVGVPAVEVFTECLRVLKPGGHLLAFGGSRTYHRLAVAVEDAGFEIRDQIMWVYGSGFPKSQDVSKAIDKAAGAEREVVGSKITGNAKQRTSSTGEFANGKHGGTQVVDITAPTTESAQRWEGWGTALKPAHEPIVLARKPLDGTVAGNVLKHGCGALNIDASRIPSGGESLSGGMINGTSKCSEGWDRPWRHNEESIEKKKKEQAERIASAEQKGRWPANLIIDGSPAVVGLFPQTSTHSTGKHDLSEYGERGNIFRGNHRGKYKSNSGSAARFFYCAKASKADRTEGVKVDNTHATVKPTDLMRYLCRLVTPPGGIVLDPFMGSGSTGKAAVAEGFDFIGIELSPEYYEIAKARIEHEQSKHNQLELFQKGGRPEF